MIRRRQLASRHPPAMTRDGRDANQPNRSRYPHSLSCGHHAFRRVFPSRSKQPSRLFSWRSYSALVGDCMLHRRHRNLDAHNYQHSRYRLRRKPQILANCAGLSCRARDSVCCIDPAVFPRRILHGLPASRKAIWHANAVRGCGGVLGYSCACGRRSDIGHRQSGKRCVRHGGTDLNLDYRPAHFVVYVRRRNACCHMDGRDPVRALPYGFAGGIFATTPQDSWWLAGGYPGCGCGGRQAHDL